MPSLSSLLHGIDWVSLYIAFGGICQQIKESMLTHTLEYSVILKAYWWLCVIKFKPHPKYTKSTVFLIDGNNKKKNLIYWSWWGRTTKDNSSLIHCECTYLLNNPDECKKQPHNFHSATKIG